MPEKIEALIGMDFDSFLKEFSNPAGNPDACNYCNNFNLFTSNESISYAIRPISGRGRIYFGVLGGIDQVFSHLAFQKPKLAILSDLNRASLDYLKIRLELLKSCENRWDYLAAILNVSELGREAREAIDFQLILRNFSGFHPSTLTRRANEKLERLSENFTHFDCDSEGRLKKFLANDFETKSFALEQFKKFISVNIPDSIYFLSDENFNFVKNMTEEGRIKAFCGDIFDYSLGKSYEVLGEEKRDVSVIYLSNVLDYLPSAAAYRNLVHTIKCAPDDATIIAGVVNGCFSQNQFSN